MGLLDRWRACTELRRGRYGWGGHAARFHRDEGHRTDNTPELVVEDVVGGADTFETGVGGGEVSPTGHFRVAVPGDRRMVAGFVSSASMRSARVSSAL